MTSIILLLLLAGKNFYFTRTHHIYYEPRPASQLTYKLDALLPGGKNLLVSEEVYVKLYDLKNAINIAQKRNLPYAILSAYAAVWVKSQQRNPFLMDFPYLYYGHKPLVEPLTKEIRESKGKVIIIVDKMNLKEIQDQTDYSIFRIALLVPKYYKRIAETRYFVIYQ